MSTNDRSNEPQVSIPRSTVQSWVNFLRVFAKSLSSVIPESELAELDQRVAALRPGLSSEELQAAEDALYEHTQRSAGLILYRGVSYLASSIERYLASRDAL